MKQIISYIDPHLNSLGFLFIVVQVNLCVSFPKDLLQSGAPCDLSFKYLCLAQNHGPFNLFPPSVVLILIAEMSPKKLRLRESASK